MAGWRNSGRRQFYCYLPKRANYIRSLMWNLFCEQTLRFFPNRPLDLRWAFSSHRPLHTHTCWELWGVHRQLGQPSFPSGATNASLMGPNRPPQTPVSPLLVCSFPTSTRRSRLDRRPVWMSVTHNRANVNICTSLRGRFLGNGKWLGSSFGTGC